VTDGQSRRGQLFLIHGESPSACSAQIARPLFETQRDATEIIRRLALALKKPRGRARPKQRGIFYFGGGFPRPAPILRPLLIIITWIMLFNKTHWFRKATSGMILVLFAIHLIANIGATD